MKFDISVIIPVYNAADFIRAAVESALLQPEVKEVILVEDASPDGSLAQCEKLVAEYPLLKLYRHPGGENRGAGASRNLGMEKASNDYISFLDADDYFLPDRFKKTFTVFQKYPDADGVYEAIEEFTHGQPAAFGFYSVNRPLPPERLFHYLIRGTYGHFHTNGLTIRKSVLQKAGVFDTTLRLHQDSELWLRFAFHGRLYPGVLDKPVTMVRTHGNNRITHANIKSRLQFWTVALAHFRRQPISAIDRVLIAWKYAKIKSKVLEENFMLEFIRTMAAWKKSNGG
ncbi:MAG TPA: glycosyltransferase family 2 protein [Chryseolinea sp.]